MSLANGSPSRLEAGQLSPPVSGSPSLRGPSTDGDDRDRSLYSASSPSTGFTSVDEDLSSDAKGFAINRTSPLARGEASISQSSGNTGKWRFPFARGSPGSSAQGFANNGVATPASRRDRSVSGRQSRATTMLDDGGFVETTSAQAAHALAQYWNDVRQREVLIGKGKGRASEDDDAGYYVSSHVSDNGKTIYRIRPRARPLSVAPVSSEQSKMSLQPPSNLPRAPSIRLTRSIPNLRSGAKQSEQSQMAAIYRDEDGFYRPTASTSRSPDTGLLSVPSDWSAIGSDGTRSERSRHSSLATSSSIPNMRAERDGDVFGRLLGWSYELPQSRTRPAVTPGDSYHTARTHLTKASSATAHTAKAKGRPAELQASGSWAYEARPPELRTPDMAAFPVSQIAPQTIKAQPMVRAATTGKLDGSAPTRSPFGQGVRLPSSPRLRRRKSMEDLPHVLLSAGLDSPSLEQEVMQDLPDSRRGSARALREVASSETIRESRQGDETMTFAMAASLGQTQLLEAIEADEDSPETPQEELPVAGSLDTRIFDIMFALDSSEWRPASSLSQASLSVSSSDGRRHKRGTSAASFASMSSLHSASSMSSATDRAHEITVTAGSGDDPRFVLYGLKQLSGALQRSSAQMQASASSVSASSGKADSPTGSGQANRRASIAGRRWSNAKRSGTLSTPPSATSPLHATPTSPNSLAQAPQKVLMAATVERWIAEITSKIEGDLMTDFFMTYRAFLTPMELCKLLQARFEWTLQSTESAEDIAARRVVRVRTYVVIRYWLLNFFPEDFVPERELRVCLTDWLNRMGKDARLRANPTDLRLIKSLKKIVKGYKAQYSALPVSGAAEVRKLAAIEDKQDQNAGRPHAASAASSISLHSVTDGKAVQTTPLDGSAGEASRNWNATASSSDRARTSSSEDDVDLNIEGKYDSDDEPVIPAIFPISPQRRLNHTPRPILSPRSPQIEPDANRSPEMLTAAPNGSEHTRFSKYLNGSFGKLKRAIGQKNQRNGDNEASPSIRSLSASTNIQHQAGLGIAGLTSESTATSRVSPDIAALTRPELHHAKSSQTIKRLSSKSRGSLRSERQPSSEGSGLQPAFVEKRSPSRLKRPETLTVQLDDYDSSDDESNYGGRVPVVRKIRRLPAARDLRSARAEGGPYLAHRHSIATISSYGGGDFSTEIMQPIRVPSFGTYDSHDSSANDGDAAGENVVPYFVPPVDSDDDEPGDVEAALRRLEGQVDQAKQKSNAKKVEMYLQKSEVAKANGGFLPEESHEEPKTLRVTNPSISSLKDIEDTVPQDAATAIVAAPTVLVEQTSAQSLAVPADSTHPPTAPKLSTDSLAAPQSIKRKSSMRRFFSSRTTLVPKASIPPTASLPPSLPSAPHRSFLLDFKSDTLAKHFTIIERDLLNKVSWQELIGMGWRKRPEIGEVTSWDAYLKQRARLNAQLNAQPVVVSVLGAAAPKKIGDIQTIIERFNLMCNWIASEIVLTTNTHTRAMLISKIVRLAFKCYRIYNFQTVTQLVHALQSPDIERLKRTWERVPVYEKRLYSTLKYFCSHLKNFRLLRDATNSLAGQWGPPGQDNEEIKSLPGVPGAIPFFGLILRDLAVNSELPTFLDPSSPRAPAVLHPDTGLLQQYAEPTVFEALPALPDDLPLRPLVNVHKYRSIAEVMTRVLTFKELAQAYPYEPELHTYRKCLALHCLSPSDIGRLSQACERP